METKYIILEDDICYDNDDFYVWGAVLYDINEKKIFTTSYGHGDDLKERPESVTYKEAVASGLITESDIKVACIGKSSTIHSYSYFDFPTNKSLNIPCRVPNRCRYVKGDAILLSITIEQDYYGDHYRMAHVYSPSQNMIADVEAHRIEFSEDTFNKLSEKVYEFMNNESVYSLVHDYAYRMSYAACDSKTLRYKFEKRLSDAFPFNDTPDITSASYPQQEARDAKKASKKEAKMIELREWAKSKIGDDATAEQIEELALKVWNRYYA